MTAEDILRKHFDEDWPEDKGVRGTDDEWKAFKETQLTFINSMILAMEEYRSQSELAKYENLKQENLNMETTSTLERIKKEAEEVALRNTGYMLEPVAIEFYQKGAISERNRTIDDVKELFKGLTPLDRISPDALNQALERLKIDLKG